MLQEYETQSTLNPKLWDGDCLKKGVGVGLHITPHVLTTDDIIRLLHVLKISSTEFKNIKNRSKILKIIKRKIYFI